MRRALLIASASIEFLAGIGLISGPGVVVPLVLGTPMEAPAAFAVCRMAGAALISLGIVCLYALRDTESAATDGIIIGMLFYNVAIPVLFVYLRFSANMNGSGLLPAAALHTIMTAWCLLSLRVRQSKSSPRLEHRQSA